MLRRFGGASRGRLLCAALIGLLSFMPLLRTQAASGTVTDCSAYDDANGGDGGETPSCPPRRMPHSLVVISQCSPIDMPVRGSPFDGMSGTMCSERRPASA